MIKAFDRLVEIMATLRSPEGCPWDKEQTHSSLKPYLIEEAYEVLESIDRGNSDELREELGDLMLQSVFHAQIARENDKFDIEDVLETINEKLIRRHPHVFGDVHIETAEEQKIHWETLKKTREGKQSVIDGVPKASPSLLRAYRVQQKAATVGFDWPAVEPVWDKIREETDELRREIQKGDKEKIEEELGDLLFALVNLSRFLKTNPEEALRGAIDKFSYRFQKVESTFQDQGKDMRDCSLDEMDAIWNKIKEEKRNLKVI